MTEQGQWTERTVQSAGGSYRISIPQKFAEGHNGVEYVQNGEFLIVRPQDYTEREKTETVPFPEVLRGESKQERYNSIVGNILQSYCVALVDEINVVFPDDLTDEEFKKYDYAWYQQQEYDKNNLRWSIEDQKMQIKGGIDLATYIDDIKQFLDRNLLNHLNQSLRFGFLDQFEFETGEGQVDDGRMYSPNSPGLNEKEASVDTRWALANRTFGEKFYTHNRSEFAKAVCGIQIGKYAETCVDLAKRIIESLAAIEFHHPDLADYVKGKVHDLFDRDTRKKYSNRLKNISEKSYNLNCTTEDFLAESEKYFTDQEKVEEFRTQCFDDFGGGDDVPTEAGMLYGQVLTFCERLLRYPRSICHIGTGAKHVADVYS